MPLYDNEIKQDNTNVNRRHRNIRLYTGDREDLIVGKNKTTGAVTGKVYDEYPQSGAIEMSDVDPILMATGVGAAYRGGASLFGAIADEVTMGGRGLLNTGVSKIKGFSNINKRLVLKSKVSNYDDLMKLTDNEIEELTSHPRHIWEQIKKKFPNDRVERELGRKLINSNKHLIEAPDYINPPSEYKDAVLDAQTSQNEWLFSDEWLKRRMAATGETEARAKVARAMMSNKLGKTKVHLKNTTGADVSPEGFASSTVENDPEIWLGIDESISNPVNRTKSKAEHELIHASNTWNEDFTMKGIEFPRIKSESKDVKVKAVVAYLNQKPEMQVRGVRTLNHIKEKGLWSSGNVSDEAIDYLKSNITRLDNDVANIVSNLDKTELKNFLNGVYSVSGIATGAGLYNNSSK